MLLALPVELIVLARALWSQPSFGSKFFVLLHSSTFFSSLISTWLPFNVWCIKASPTCHNSLSSQAVSIGVELAHLPLIFNHLETQAVVLDELKDGSLRLSPVGL